FCGAIFSKAAGMSLSRPGSYSMVVTPAVEPETKTSAWPCVNPCLPSSAETCGVMSMMSASPRVESEIVSVASFIAINIMRPFRAERKWTPQPSPCAMIPLFSATSSTTDSVRLPYDQRVLHVRVAVQRDVDGTAAGDIQQPLFLRFGHIARDVNQAADV